MKHKKIVDSNTVTEIQELTELYRLSSNLTLLPFILNNLGIDKYLTNIDTSTKS